MATKEQIQSEVVNPAGNFKHSIEVQNLYRFVSDNNLRREAQMLLKLVHGIMAPKKKRRGRAKKKVLQ